MNTLVDNINLFRVQPEQLNISKIDFENKLSKIGCPAGPGEIGTDRVLVKIPTRSKNPIVHRNGNYKELLSNLIKEHVKAFDEISWK